jgi:hypothetical protein
MAMGTPSIQSPHRNKRSTPRTDKDFEMFDYQQQLHECTFKPATNHSKSKSK